jgi:hypothetical protein
MNMVHDEDLLATRKETESWSDKGNVKMTAWEHVYVPYHSAGKCDREMRPSQLTALKSTNSIKLASISIRKYVKKPKITIFRHRKMHVRIESETWNFVQQSVHVKMNGLENFKYERYREGCFLEPPFSNKFPW